MLLRKFTFPIIKNIATQQRSVVSLKQILTTSQTVVIGGREGNGRTKDGKFEIKIKKPDAIGEGVTPEDLFGIGYSSFLGAMHLVSKQIGTGELPAAVQVETKVHFGKPTLETILFGLAMEMEISDPSGKMTTAQLEKISEAAHKICPYSVLSRNNLDLKIVVK